MGMFVLANPAPPDEHELLLAAQAGEHAALVTLAERYWPSIRRWCLFAMADTTRAEDAASDALVRLMERIHQCDAQRPFKPWLRALVRNVCRDAARAQRRAADRHAHLAEVPSKSGVARRLDLDQGARRALAALDQLTPAERTVIQRCDIEGLSPREAAEALEIAGGTVRALLHRARRKLRLALVNDRAEILDLLRDA